MSSTTTPTRHGRGMPVPGIDTRGAAEKTAPSLQFQSWPLTPPQSANESRRPSLAYSALSSDTTHSGPSSVGGYSQPATPIHSMNNSTTDFRTQWSDGAEVHAPMPMQDGCGAGQTSHQMFGSMDTMCAQMSHMTSPMQQAWPQQHSSYHGVPSGLSTTLFQSSQGLGPEQVSAPMYGQHPETMPTSLEASAFSRYDVPMSAARQSYQQPQVVVPSQVAPPEEYAMDQRYDAREGNNGIVHSFDSSMTGWESVGPPSPVDAYFAHSDDDDFAMVKTELPMTPPSGSYHRPTAFFDVGQSGRTKRRSSKRSRKVNGDNHPWYTHSVGDTTISCVGQKFVLNVSDSDPDAPLSKRVISENTKDRKPHMCKFLFEDNAQCGRRFERMEHLKRHQESHSKERKYPCPLEFCKTKAIGRPDNACDHFKTHLRPHSKGKRNKPCDWATLEKAIWKTYSEKAAGKILTNLRKWMVAEHDKAVAAEAEQQQQQQQVMAAGW